LLGIDRRMKAGLRRRVASDAGHQSLECDKLMVIHAVYENGVFHPTEPVQLPENCQVELVVQREPSNSPPTTVDAPLTKLAAIAASHPQNPDLPTDLATQHDHYLYGSPKRG
jgi:predicted DNA-binding antitoxin AbrB/MazE fold protein